MILILQTLVEGGGGMYQDVKLGKKKIDYL